MGVLMNSIQIGLDIATSVSVVFAAITFLWTTLGQSKKARMLSIKQQRIEHMSRLVSDFSKILEDGDKIVEKVRMAQSGRELTVSADDYTGFCIAIDRYIRINSKLLFEVWASDAEKKVLHDIQILVHSWNKQFIEAATTNNKSEIPSFDQLIEDIGVNVKKLSSLLREEVENVNA
jgi:hypothetical protein